MKKIQIRCMIAVIALFFAACDKEQVYITYEDGPMAGVARMGYRGEGYDVTVSDYSGGNSAQLTSLDGTSWYYNGSSYGTDYIVFISSNRGYFYNAYQGERWDFSYSYDYNGKYGYIYYDAGGTAGFNISDSKLYFRGNTFIRQ